MGKETVLRPVRGMRLVAILAIGGVALAVAGCGEPPAKDSGDTSAKKFKACMVTDVGGIDDRSFNASAWKGFQDAKKANSNIDIQYNASTSEQDYEPNLAQFVQRKCDLIVAVGGLMTDATKKIADQNKDQKFAIIDSNTGQSNVYSMQFNTAQAAFQAGYVAAASSKSGKVATYGGLPIPPVTIYMDGFYEGVQYYNKQKSKNVAVLGWNEKTQKGTFSQNFTDQAKGKAITDTFVSQGADIVFPVAGGTGLGTASAAQASGGKFSAIFVDFDGCESAQQYCSAFLTSVVKNIPEVVTKAIEAAAKGEALTGSYIGTLDNRGTFLAPYHDFDSKVPAELKTEVDQIGKDISSGKITLTSPAQPK